MGDTGPGGHFEGLTTCSDSTPVCVSKPKRVHIENRRSGGPKVLGRSLIGSDVLIGV